MAERVRHRLAASATLAAALGDSGAVVRVVCAAVAWSVGVAGFALSRDIGLSADSAVYVYAARSFAAGEGLRTGPGPGLHTDAPLCHYPPLYPWLLGAAEWAGLPVLHAARALNVLCAALSAVGLALCCLRAAPPRLAAPLCALLCAHPFLVLPHAMAWSEPLFVTLLLMLGLALPAARVSVAGAAVAGVCAGALCLTRYAGVAFAAAAGAALLFDGAPRRACMRRAAVFAGVVGLCVAGWWLRNRLLPGDASGARGLAFHPPGLWHVRTVFGALFDGVAPPELGASGLRLLSATAWVALVAGCARAVWRGCAAGAAPRAAGAGRFWLWGLGAYLALLAFVLVFADAQTPLDARLLLPAGVCTALAGLPWVAHAATGPGSGWLRGPLWGLAVLSAVASLRVAQQAAHEGLEFTRARREPPALLARVAALPEDMRVLSNAPDWVYAITDRPAWEFPARVNPFTERPVPREQRRREQASWRAAAEEGTVGVLVAPGFSWRRHQVPAAELVAVLGLVEVDADRGARLYLSPSQATRSGIESR